MYCKDWNVENFRQPIWHKYFYRFFGNFPDISYQSSPRTGYKNLSNFFIFYIYIYIYIIRCYLVIWSWFAGKGCVFQPGSKIVDLGFVKLKPNGTKAKRPLEQIQKTQGAKKSKFFGFPWGFSMDFLGNQTRMNFPGNRMGGGFSWESNGGCKKNKNMIRLVPARIESGRGK